MKKSIMFFIVGIMLMGCGDNITQVTQRIITSNTMLPVKLEFTSSPTWHVSYLEISVNGNGIDSCVGQLSGHGVLTEWHRYMYLMKGDSVRFTASMVTNEYKPFLLDTTVCIMDSTPISIICSPSTVKPYQYQD